MLLFVYRLLGNQNHRQPSWVIVITREYVRFKFVCIIMKSTVWTDERNELVGVLDRKKKKHGNLFLADVFSYYYDYYYCYYTRTYTQACIRRHRSRSAVHYQPWCYVDTPLWTICSQNVAFVWSRGGGNRTTWKILRSVVEKKIKSNKRDAPNRRSEWMRGKTKR